MREDFILAGFGGQGIQFSGKWLAFTGMTLGHHVTFMPSYGAEVRGGTAHCHVIWSDAMIASPVIVSPTVVVAMNRQSAVKFALKVLPGGLLVINSSLMEWPLENGLAEQNSVGVLEVPATECAYKLGDVRVANMIIVGAMLARKKTCTLDQALQALGDFLPTQKKAHGDLNQKALRAGYEMAGVSVS